MILRGLNLLKIAHRSNQSKIAATNLRSVRLCYTGHVYRNIGMAEEKKWVYTAEAFGGLMWWWILWHFWHDFGHIVITYYLKLKLKQDLQFTSYARLFETTKWCLSNYTRSKAIVSAISTFNYFIHGFKFQDCLNRTKNLFLGNPHIIGYF
ncbi:hypothetical protein ALC62_11171 [Cyphomyrmex costatus]|uniref:NADH dehydrogenase [ubiquinone] 1 beta subcomplex subunit 2, mitochondrial n=1 Tax=Cyphomyrmex costatus TaxID=456900 RepID=A0A195CBV9_9HYME|nr:hypothetical protein ALC62_11171 [Cyphomyrmex costatus]